MKKILISHIFLLFAIALIAQDRGNVLIKDGTVLTITKGVLENTDVLIEDGKISKIGQDLKAKSGIQTIDAKGKFVMPGIIDAHSHIGIDAVNEATSPVTAEVWVGDAFPSETAHSVPDFQECLHGRAGHRPGHLEARDR